MTFIDDGAALTDEENRLYSAALVTQRKAIDASQSVPTADEIVVALLEQMPDAAHTIQSFISRASSALTFEGQAYLAIRSKDVTALASLIRGADRKLSASLSSPALVNTNAAVSKPWWKLW